MFFFQNYIQDVGFSNQKLLIFTVVIRRQYIRYLIKLPVEISFGDELIRGTTVRVSGKGFFVRSQKTFPVRTLVDINLHLTDESSCKLKGIIKYARNIKQFEPQKNGMGIELTEGNLKYLEFIKSFEDNFFL